MKRELTLSNQNELRSMSCSVKPTTIDLIAERFSCAPCTLNGQEAKISGRLMKYAVIAPYDMRYACVEFSWEAVERIMTDGNGAFRC
jgi:hypothetical protein